MQAWTHEIGDVLLIKRNNEEIVARVVGYKDSLDNSTPLYVNLRVSGGLRWGERKTPILARQIIRALPEWYAEQKAKFDASIKEAADRAYARMTPEQKAKLEREQCKRRSPLDIMIDRACGIE